MLVDRKNKFQHIICTIIKDKKDEKYQSFSRGNALTIFERCTDYWNGSKIEPIQDTVANSIKEIVAQWDANDFDSIGFSYKPATPDIIEEFNRLSEDETKMTKKQKELI